MSLLGLTPVVWIRVRNPLLGRAYPGEGEAMAVIDTGYEGFLALPRDAFESLGLGELRLEERLLLLPGGRAVKARGVYVSVDVGGATVYGFAETFEGLDELVLGQEFLANFKLVVDYCSASVALIPCKPWHRRS
ncbi:MAG: clan AA aspartic protease [Thermoprotei archaeon]|nr:MAG: clan AA aspartic protease [Thermoprotei archaeon]